MKDHRGPRPETLLITLSGKDRPGVTSAIFATLSRAGVEVVDICLLYTSDAADE